MLEIYKNLYWIIPEIYITIGIVVLLAYGVIYAKKGGKYGQLKNMYWLSILTILFSVVLKLEEWISIDNSIITISNGVLLESSLSIMIKIVVMLAGLGILVVGLVNQKIPEFEFPLLILLTILGISTIVSSNNLISLYLGIELLSLSLYVMAGIKRHGQFSTEAGLKYFILGALSSGIYLIGAGIIYLNTGELGFDGLNLLLWYSEMGGGIVIIGAMLILVALLFKLAAAPFHMWAPDVYEGAPTIVTAYFAIVPKIGLLGIFITIVTGPFIGIFEDLQPLILFSAALSLFVGSIGALNQSKIKRLLAYSAIGHMGFMLLGIAPLSIFSLQATVVYILLYIIMSLNSFTFVLSFYKTTSNYITQLSGLSRSHPVLAISFAMCLLSIAGIPPLAGFFSKYLVLLSAIESNLYLIAIFAVVCSVISAFYYLRLIKWMYFKDTSDFFYKDLGDAALPSIHIPLPYSIIMGITTYFILTLLIYPQPLMFISFQAITSTLI